VNESVHTPPLPLPQGVVTAEERERWHECVGAAHTMAEGSEFAGDRSWLGFVARQLYESDIPTE
jgi:hypothetical protein